MTERPVLGAADDPPDEPISPELVLVSPELAERARAQLPPISLYEPRRRRDRPLRATLPEPAQPVPESPREPRRWPRRVAAAAFLLGGATLASYLVGDRRPIAVGADIVAPSSSASASRPRPPRVVRGPSVRDTPSALPAARRSKRLHLPTPRAPVPSVLGVVATAGNGFVRLEWERPEGIERVAVVRIDGRRRLRRYAGARTSFVDRSVQNGRTYRYVLLSYDRAGRSSNGVITVIRPGPA